MGFPATLTRTFLAGLLFSVCQAVRLNADDEIVVKLNRDQILRNEVLEKTMRGGEWLESPWGSVYQFRAGDQSWLTAREHCLAMSSDLAVIKNGEQLDWILSHYAPVSARFSPRLIQVGLYLPEGQNRDWQWVDESEISPDMIWAAGEPFDHSTNGKERCGLLSVESRRLDDVDCESTLPDHVAQRFICQRTKEAHKKQQKSNNYIWEKIEQVFSYIGVGTTTISPVETKPSELVPNKNVFAAEKKQTSEEEQKEVEAVLARLPKPTADVIEGSGEAPRTHARAHATPLKEIDDTDGSGAHVEKINVEIPKEFIQIDDPAKLDKVINNMEKMLETLDSIAVGKEEKVIESPKLTRTTVESKKSSTTTTAPEVQLTNSKASIKTREEVDSNIVAEVLEEDFNEEKSKDMPKADIKPPHEKEEDCEPTHSPSPSSTAGPVKDVEESSGADFPVTVAASVESDEGSGDEDAFQKIEIPREREEHVKEFLGVLHQFLERAEQGDLRKLLDDKSGKTLLQRMRDAIREANRREFQMLELMEELKKNGANGKELEFTKSERMPQSERDELYKKISSVVIHAAEKEKTVAPVAQTTTPASDLVTIVSAKENTKKPILEPITVNTQVEEAKIEGSGVNESGVKSKKHIAHRTPKKDSKSSGSSDYYGDYLELEDSNDGTPEKKSIKKIRKTTTASAATESTTASTTAETSTTTSTATATTTAENGEVATKRLEAVEVTTASAEQPKKEDGHADKVEVIKTIEAKAKKALSHPELEGIEEDVVPLKKLESDVQKASEVVPATVLATKTEFEKRIDTKNLLQKIKDREEKMVAPPPVALPAPLPIVPPAPIPIAPPATIAPTPFPPLPTLEEVLKNLGAQFKKLLAPPQPLPTFG